MLGFSCRGENGRCENLSLPNMQWCQFRCGGLTKPIATLSASRIPFSFTYESAHNGILSKEWSKEYDDADDLQINVIKNNYQTTCVYSNGRYCC